MRPALLAAVLDREFAATKAGTHTPVMLWGPPGVGKSDLVRQIAQQHAVPLIDVRLSQMEPSDLRGIPFRQQDQVEWAIPSMLPDGVRHGAEGILFLDEITSAPPSVSAAAYQLILDRRLGDYRVPAGWAIVAAGNRQGDRGVSYTMPSPLANRFSHYQMDCHLDDWVSWAYSQRIDERVIGFLRFRPELLFDFDPAHNPVAFPTPRSWFFAHRALQKFGDQPALLNGALQACVGPAAGAELHGFVQSLEQLPDIDAIVRGEEQATPGSIDLQYAVASALVGRALRLQGSEDFTHTLNHILRYATRFKQREMGVMLVADLHRAVGQRLYDAPGFDNWADAVADILLYQ